MVKLERLTEHGEVDREDGAAADDGRVALEARAVARAAGRRPRPLPREEQRIAARSAGRQAPLSGLGCSLIVLRLAGEQRRPELGALREAAPRPERRHRYAGRLSSAHYPSPPR